VKSIGIYPGTFDPIHEGHTAFALAAISECNLSMIYFAPEKVPRDKFNVTDLQVRIANMRSVLGQNPTFDILSLSSDRFTVTNTKPEIEARLSPAQYTLLLGSDVAIRLEGWPDIDALLSKWGLAIGMRNSDNAKNIELMIKRLEKRYGFSIRRSFIYTDKAGLSSSGFRHTQ
jgi:nicotinate-nucleotide adenylyltransferase